MTRLSVNINKIATLRNARGGNIPDVKQAAIDCQKFGAQGITIHPRPDERHIKRSDVFEIKPIITTEFNIEGYPSGDFIDMVCSVKPDQVTLVPDSAKQLTSNHGWDTAKHISFLKDVIAEFKANNIRTSIFVGAEPDLVEAAAKTATDRIELYTEPYANDFAMDPKKAIAPFIIAAKVAFDSKIGINAGHDLNLFNLNYFYKNIPGLLEVSIGHALISDALYFGLESTIKKYLDCLR
jgi:pyridoxine 5-phosphate synthase